MPQRLSSRRKGHGVCLNTQSPSVSSCRYCIIKSAGRILRCAAIRRISLSVKSGECVLQHCAHDLQSVWAKTRACASAKSASSPADLRCFRKRNNLVYFFFSAGEIVLPGVIIPVFQKGRSSSISPGSSSFWVCGTPCFSGTALSTFSMRQTSRLTK